MILQSLKFPKLETMDSCERRRDAFDMGPLKRFVRETNAVLHIAGPGVTARWLLAAGRHARTILASGNFKTADIDVALCPDLSLRVLGRTLTIPGDLFGGAREMYGRGVYFRGPGLPVQPGDVVVDLGANRGLFTLLALKLGASKVVAVEAQSGFIPLIQELLEKNDCASGAILVWSLVGSHTGLLFYPAAQATASHWRGMPPRQSICELIRAHSIDRIDFLKIDIEGSEFDLFEQTSDWLPKVGRLAMELHVAFGAVNRIAKALLSDGFRVELAYPDLTPTDSLGSSCGYLYAYR